jgi:hypothetical protein
LIRANSFPPLKLQDAVTTAHETSDAFSDETLREQTIFQHAKEAEMKEMLGNLADGQIEFYKAVSGIDSSLILYANRQSPGYGRMGEDNTTHSKNSCGCIVDSI